MRKKKRNFHCSDSWFSTNKKQISWKIISIHRCKIKAGFVTSFLKLELKKKVSLSTSLTVHANYPFSYANKKKYLYMQERQFHKKKILMCNITNAENKTGRVFAQQVYIYYLKLQVWHPWCHGLRIVFFSGNYFKGRFHHQKSFVLPS